MMNIEVMSRKNLSARSYNRGYNPYRIISINGLPDGWTDIDDSNPEIDDVLTLHFDDVECGENGCMTEQDAKDIVIFADQCYRDGFDLIVHCAAGISRSAGVAAALMLIFNGDDSPIFSNSRYAPNYHCYRSVLDAALMSYDFDEVDKRFKVNEKIWFEAYSSEW